MLCSHQKNSKTKTKTKSTTKEHEEIFEDLFSILMVVMVSQVNAYVQTHQDVYTKCMYFFVYYTSIKLRKGKSFYNINTQYHIFMCIPVFIKIHIYLDSYNHGVYCSFYQK